MASQRFDQPDLQQLASPRLMWYPTPLLASKPAPQDYVYGATVLRALAYPAHVGWFRAARPAREVHQNELAQV